MNRTRTIRKAGAITAACVLFAGLLIGGCSDDDSDAVGANDHAATDSSSPELRAGMRKLWEDHVTWTRLVIISLAEDLPDTQVTLNRLLQNQQDIGDAIKPFYGDAAGDQLTALLREHIVIAGDILGAAKAGDAAKKDAAVARWYTNADQIAGFLAKATPDHWPAAEMTAMMKGHLDLTLEEAVAQLTGDYAASVAAYDKIHAQFLGMADMLSDGIAAQFPDKVS